ncbi:MAG: hypothetical protein A2498_05860 [Lentisphaerae bacterium RIFOXYC12_FULL_60_16]|nr:MAG: hypothetical protein A2498_05860 [Lentisphaerae bacterium RIFOXYC12_FULL_60_16]OGV75170.1 MAG: hypothetical protein A2269_07025 [Lentisphaerae bacterium RIFOXYA12_FULL_60_10]OGV82548.1 MAG: hypothetical protein A2340_10920 [Lentisphaerae bacterium RIFOXYB12_FULL_60_10]
MSVLARVIEERQHWVERNHNAEAQRQRVWRLIRFSFMATGIVLGYTYRIQLVDVLMHYLVK